MIIKSDNNIPFEYKGNVHELSEDLFELSKLGVALNTDTSNLLSNLIKYKMDKVVLSDKILDKSIDLEINIAKGTIKDNKQEVTINNFITSQLGEQYFVVQNKKGFYSAKGFLNIIEKLSKSIEKTQDKFPYYQKAKEIISVIPEKWKPIISKNIKDEQIKKMLEAKKEAKQVQQQPKKPTTYNNNRLNKKRLDDDEIKRLRDETLEEIKSSDPTPILTALGIDYKKVGNRYVFAIRPERTPSTWFSNKYGNWNFNDFGGSAKGSVIDLVKEVSGVDYKDAFAFCVDTLGIKDRVAEALEQKKQEYRFNLEEVKRKNQSISKSIDWSNLNGRDKDTLDVELLEVETEDPMKFRQARHYLQDRGIYRVPKDFFFIKAKVKKTIKDKESGDLIVEYKNPFGVGVVTAKKGDTILGADIHFTSKNTDLKSIVIGKEGITSIYNKGNNEDGVNILIFESKMDYAGLYQLDKFKDIMENQNSAIFVLNSVSHYEKLFKKLDKLKEKGVEVKNVFFNGQYDEAGLELADKVLTYLKDKEVAPKDKIFVLDYLKVDKNNYLYKKDVNDVVKDGLLTDKTIGSFYSPYSEELHKKLIDKKNQLLEKKVKNNNKKVKMSI